jgi:pSer/pThr/pTyr-binding forkhead associated (FHA) protein
MIIYCEECGYKNTIDEERLKKQGLQIPCEQCGDLLHFYGVKAEALQQKAGQKRTRESQDSLIVQYGAVVIEVNEKKRRVTIGRQKTNDIQVLNNRVSRSHAWIEYRDDTYYLVDQSSNGTYLLIEGNKGIALRRKEIVLTAKGVIGPGYKVEIASPEGIHFRFEKKR